MAGCTAVSAMIIEKVLYVANSGDSRAVLCRNGQAIAMSNDHKPENQEELDRILAAGGTVIEGRVNGNLNLCRSLGDFEYKSDPALSPEAQMITANPEIKTIELTAQDEFLVLACDGVWDILSNQECCDFIKERLKTHQLEKIIEEMFERCLAKDIGSSAGLGCDNMTAVILTLNGL